MCPNPFKCKYIYIYHTYIYIHSRRIYYMYSNKQDIMNFNIFDGSPYFQKDEVLRKTS